MSRLSLRTYSDGRELRIELTGELDLSSARQFEEALRRAERDEPELLVLDLRSLKFLDSTGLRLILSANTRANREGRHLKLLEGGKAVQRIFRLTGVDERLDIVGSSEHERVDVAGSSAPD